MKKKSIFVVALAALMLIAFTACEQPVPGLSKSIIDATIVQDGTIFAGQPFDASKFSVNVTYSDKTTGTLKGVSVTYAETDGNINKVQNGDKVSVVLPVSAPNYSGNNTVTTDMEFTGSIVAYMFSSVTIEGTESLPYDTTGSAFVGDVEITSVVGNYKDSNGTAQQYTFSADEYTVGEPALSGDAPADEGETAKAYVNVTPAFGATEATAYYFDATYYVAPDPETETWTWNGQIAVEVLDESADTGAYVQRGEFDASKMLKVYKVEVSSLTGDTRTETEVSAGSGETLTIALASPYTGTTDRFAATATNRVNVTYTYVDNEVTGHLSTVTANATINTRADYITNLGAPTWTGKGGVASTGYDVGNQIPATDFTYTLTWKSGITDNTIPASQVRVTPATAPSLESQNASYSVTISYVNQSYSDCADDATTTVTINADPNWEDPNA